MEYKIGEIFNYDGEWYQCVEEIGCDGCAFDTICGEINDIIGNCTSSLRHDDKSVVFKKLEKVGEPFPCRNMSSGRYGIMVQWYKVFVEPILTDDSTLSWYNSINETILIALNNKEDMEEDNNTKHSNSENIGKNLKPFSLEAAKSGKPVCTRNGRKARILCFDRNAVKYHIVALIECKGFPNKEEEIKVYDNDGKYFANGESPHDLMMLPEKKEGWVNIDKGGSGKIAISSPYSTKEEAIHNDNETTIDTIKISWEE